MSIRRRVAAVLAVVVLPVLVIAGLVGGVLLPRALVDGQHRDVERASVALASAMASECWTLGDRAEVIALSVANGRNPAAVLAEETRGALGADHGYVVVSRAGAVVARSAGAPQGAGTDLPATRCSAVTQATDPVLAERVDVTTTQGTLSVLVVEPLTSGRLDALARQAAVGPVRTVLVCAGGREVHPSSDAGQGEVVSTVEAGSGRPCAVQGSSPDPTGGVRAWLPLALLAVMVLGAWMMLRWLARELTAPIVALRDAARRMGEGDLTVRLPVRRRDEVGEVARELNAMAEELDRRMAELRASRETVRTTAQRIAATLQRTHDLDGLLTALCGLAETTTTSTAASVWLREGDRLRLRVVHPIGMPRPARQRVPLEDSLVGRVAQERTVVRLDAAPGGDVSMLGARLCAAPLVSGDSVVGVLVVERPSDRPAYDAETADLLDVVTGPAGVAVDNAMLHRQAQRESVVDPLTGAGNLRALTTSLTREIERARRFARPLSVLVVDIDHFRELNAVRGERVGDGVLVALAARLRETVSAVDVIARYGGEEMAVVCPETGPAAAQALAERVVTDLRVRPLVVDGAPVAIRVSVGAASWPVDGDTASCLLESADRAVVAAKEAGRDRAVHARTLTSREVD